MSVVEKMLAQGRTCKSCGVEWTEQTRCCCGERPDGWTFSDQHSEWAPWDGYCSQCCPDHSPPMVLEGDLAQTGYLDNSAIVFLNATGRISSHGPWPTEITVEDGPIACIATRWRLDHEYNSFAVYRLKVFGVQMSMVVTR